MGSHCFMGPLIVLGTLCSDARKHIMRRNLLKNSLKREGDLIRFEIIITVRATVYWCLICELHFFPPVNLTTTLWTSTDMVDLADTSYRTRIVHVSSYASPIRSYHIGSLKSAIVWVFIYSFIYFFPVWVFISYKLANATN